MTFWLGGDWLLQNAVEGTHRDLVQAVLTLNR